MISRRYILKYILSFSFIFFIFCKNQKIKNELVKREKISYNIEFPDTVFVDKSYNGLLRYKSILDTITTSFDDKTKKRYPLFYLTIVEKPYKDYKKLKKEAKIYGADNNRIFSLTNIKFSKSGIYYLDGIINDYVVIDITQTNKKKQDLIREIENEARVTFKVVVLPR